MHLLQLQDKGEFSLVKFSGSNIPRYAILSHTWGSDNDEVTFQDVTNRTGESKAGYRKIRFCGEQAKHDGLRYFWVDTCCIDKSSSQELLEAINSMFRWYKNAERCYVYLSDVSNSPSDLDSECTRRWKLVFKESRWFTRGWTLQELLAPASVEFFSRDGKRLGDKRSLERQIHDITGVAIPALRGTPLSEFSVDERMSWAKARQTKREEDKAYSLLGIFGVYMPLIYGEGTNAFHRLQKEIFGDIPLYRLPYATAAPFNSYIKQHEPTCLPDTRVHLLRDIYNWADGEDEGTIFWLNGLAGTGKSTIARTVARHYFNKRRLGASFFFSRGGGDISHAGKFVTSIAMQLTASIPALHQYISSAVAERSDIASRSLRDQWHELVLSPLSRLDTSDCQSLYILVIDALDECVDEKNIQTILYLLAKVRSLEKVRLRVFLTSRPEIPIRYGFRQIPDEEHRDFVLHNISASIVDHDIDVFVKRNLNLIRREHSLDDSWPGEDIVRQLVHVACGLFIWAATACRFIREGKRFATKRLHMILKDSGSAVTEPERHLDEIYTTVLRNSISPNYTDEERKDLYCQLRCILGSIVLLFSPLSVPSLQKLLHTTEGIDQTLEDLHSVIDIPKDNTHALRLHHPSFRDFLLSKGRCQEPALWVDEKQAHEVLTDNCIRLLSTCLKQDICEVNTPGMLAAGIESSVVERYLPPEVQYACIYWIQHLQKSGSQLHDGDQVHCFLQEHLLHWLEALGWISKVSEGIHAMIALESAAAAYCCPLLSDYVHDARRFVLSNRHTIEQAPLQIYCSALIFAPTTSITREQYKKHIPGWIRQLPRVKNDWNALLQTLEGHSGPVRAVAFSPDGALLASASADYTVKMWDARSGAALQTFKGHLDSVIAVAFSPDGALLASTSSKKSGPSSNDTIVKLWNTWSGAALQTLEGHSDRIIDAVAFSPDGTLLGWGSSGSIVKLWDARSGAALQTFEGHSGPAKAVAFSPDGALLALALADNTVKMWDARSGAALQTFEGHLDFVIAVAFSPDGTLLASGSADRTVKLWNAWSGAVLHTLEGHSMWVSSIAFSPDGTLLASASDDTTIQVWDIQSGAALQTLEGHSMWIGGIAFSPDGTLLASGSADRTIKLWDARSGPKIQTLEGHSKWVDAVAFSPDGTLLASASKDTTIKLWDTQSAAVIQTLEGHSEWINDITFSPDGTLLASGSADSTVKLWNAQSGALLHTLEGHSMWVGSIAFSPDGTMLASASWDKTIKLWDARSGAMLQTLEGHADWIRAQPGFGGLIGLDIKKSSPICHMMSVGFRLAVAQPSYRSNIILAIAFSPDGMLLASASWAKTVKLWDARSGVALQMLEGHLCEVSAIAFSPDGTLLASVSIDRTVKVWDARSGTVLETLQVDIATNALLFSDGQPYLETRSGWLHSTFLCGDASVPRPSAPASLFVKKRWVSHCAIDLLWLPSEYAPSSIAVNRHMIGWGCGSGGVFIMELDSRNTRPITHTVAVEIESYTNDFEPSKDNIELRGADDETVDIIDKMEDAALSIRQARYEKTEDEDYDGDFDLEDPDSEPREELTIVNDGLVDIIDEDNENEQDEVDDGDMVFKSRPAAPNRPRHNDKDEDNNFRDDDKDAACP